MSDSFFGFDASEPAFGLGGKESNDLVEAGEDQQIDLLNDETFGDFGEDADWDEDEHEKLTEESGFHHRNGHSNYSEYESQGDDLEQSLNRLVVDDEEDQTGIPIGRRNTRVEDLFGPTSPPSLLLTESLVSPGRQNVWGSPMRDQFTTSERQQEGLQNLLKTLQKNQAQEFQDPAIVNAGKPMPGNLPPARTLHGFEGNRGQSVPTRPFTVEELEKEMQQGRKISTPPAKGFPLPIGTPPGPTILQDFTRMPPPLPHMQPPPHLQGPTRGSPGLGPSAMQTANITSILKRPSPPNTSQGQQAGRDILGGSAKNERPPPQMMGNFFQNNGTPVQQRLQFPMGHSDPTHGKFNHGRGGHNMGRGGVDPRQAMFNSQQRKHTVYTPSKYDQQMMAGGDNKDSDNMRGYSNNMRGGPGGQRGRGGRGGYHQHSNRDSPYHYNRDNQYGKESDDDENKDEYSNLMTKKEKDWIIKIQLMQLQTDNPYLDDFYFTTWQMNKKAEELRKKEIEKGKKPGQQQPKLVLPQMSKLDNKTYKPIQFEGSLGRLTASSVHNPRKIIDIGARRNSESEDAKGKEMRRYKSLLVDIEMSYNLLLTIDDLDKKGLALPEEARGPLIEERTSKINALFLRLNCHSNKDDGFSRIVTVRKGIKLVTRTIPLLNHEQAYIVVCAVLAHLGTISRKEYQDEILPPLFNNMQDVINVASLEMLVRFADELRMSSTDANQTNSIVTALQNKFGSSVIWCLVNRGEVVYTTANPLEMDVEHQRAWTKFVITVSETVSSLSKDSLAAPQDAFKLVPSHLERVLDKRSYVVVEDILQQVIIGSKIGKSA